MPTRKPQQSTALAPPPDSWPRWAQGSLLDVVTNFSERSRVGVVLVEEDIGYGEFFVGNARKPWAGKGPVRVVVLWAALPLNPTRILDWRNALIEEAGVAYRMVFLESKEQPDEGWLAWFQSQLGDWAAAVPNEEDCAFEVAKRVRYQPDQTSSYDPSMLMVALREPMASILAQLDECKRRFREAMNVTIKGNVGNRRQKVLEALQDLYAYAGSETDCSAVSKNVSGVIRKQGLVLDRRQLPRVLLLGPSGSGKTHVARYLAWRTSVNSPDEVVSRPFKRVPVPEYLGKEDMFEYDVFGYTAGAYTGGRADGSKGFLAERMGGVVFFDEIGDASPQVQAKLLAYLDDYLISPRGWEGEPFFCPMLVVAATNRPVLEWAEHATRGDTSSGRFRNDLLRRFNVIIRLPALNERSDDLEYLLDVLLQQQAFNPRDKIKRVGVGALEAIRALDFDLGNFRTLEIVVSQACAAAANSGRDFLVRSDIANQGFPTRTKTNAGARHQADVRR